WHAVESLVASLAVPSTDLHRHDDRERGSARHTRARLFELAIGSAFASALSTALIEYGITLRHAHPTLPGDRPALLLLLIALYSAASLLVGVAEGVIVTSLLAAGVAEVGRSLIDRLRRDERFDREAAGTLMAACVAAAAFAFWVAQL